MAKSKQKKSKTDENTLTKTESATEIAVTQANGSPYQLDTAQVERAATALIAQMKKHAQKTEEDTGKKNLAADEDDTQQSDELIFLTVSTKRQIKDSNRLKPSKITIPHSLQLEDVRVCLMTADPQRQFKNIVADEAFPEILRARIGRVIGLDKLKRKYKTYETQRQLFAEYDVFLADDRIMTSLPKLLGKTFYGSKGKRPLPVALAPQAPKNKDGKRPYVIRDTQGIAKEIERALSSTPLHFSATNQASACSIRVGRLSQTPKQLQENIEAVVEALTSKFVSQGWRNILALHVKGARTVALPIWSGEQLWATDDDVLEAPRPHAIKDSVPKISQKKRKWDAWEEEMLDEDDLAERRARAKSSKKSRSKKQPVGEAIEHGSISKERRKKLKEEALQSVQTALTVG